MLQYPVLIEVFDDVIKLRVVINRTPEVYSELLPAGKTLLEHLPGHVDRFCLQLQMKYPGL